MITISSVALGFIGFSLFLLGFGLGAAVTAVQIVRDSKDLHL